MLSMALKMACFRSLDKLSQAELILSLLSLRLSVIVLSNLILNAFKALSPLLTTCSTMVFT